MRAPTISPLDDWLSLRARTHPDRPAIVAGGRTVVYRELHDGAERTARRLAALGVSEGDRVASALPPGIEFAELMHALPRLGAVLVPLNTREADPPTAGARLVVSEPVDGVEAPDAPLRSTVDPDSVFAVVHTSGTSAAPKPVELTYRNFFSSAVASAWNLGVDPDDRWLCAMPLFHVGGLSILTRSAIYGTCAVVHERFDADAVRESLESGEATLISVVATMLRRLRAAGLTRAPDLRAALVGGGPVPRDLLDWAASVGLPVIPTYGMTETCSQIATPHLLPGVEVNTGDDGELLVRGPMVAPGALAGDGWLHTGDEGALDADGNLTVTGRAGDTIITGGENVAPAEVEAVLAGHPSVAEAAVHGAQDREWGQRVVATVVLRAGQTATEDELRGYCRVRLAGYKVPRVVRFAPELPRTVSGKLLRRFLED
jgi:O-succinylbenzoic acid--CoA ligase